MANANARVSQELMAAMTRLESRTGTSTFLVARMSDDGKVELEHEGSPTEGLMDLAASLPADSCRFGVFKANFETKGGQRTKMLFVLWTPSAAPRVQKFAFAMYAKSVQSSLSATGAGFNCSLQAGARDDLNSQEVLARVSKFEHDEVIQTSF